MACFAHHDTAERNGSERTGSERDTEPMPFAEPGVRPHYAPDRAVRILHAAIRISLEPAARRFEGVARLRLAAYPGYRGRIELDLDEVTVDGVTDGGGADLPYDHADGELVVRAETLPDEIVVRWHGADPRRGLYFVGPTAAEPDRSWTAWTQCQDEDAHFVFPCQDHPSVKHPWTLALDAPAGYTLLSNGRRGDAGERDGRVYARFEQEEPMPAYLVTFVAAPLVAIDAAAGALALRYLVPPGTETHVERAFGRTPAMIAHFAERTGVPYPWPRYDQVVVQEFVFGGMENVACTTMTDLLLVDEKAALEWEPDALVSHELAHQWFGDLVTCQDWSQGWLNESWATYMEAVWWEHHHGEPEATWYRFQTAGAYHAEAAGRYRRPIVSYDFREPIDVFDRHLYNKGSCVLWTLRFQLGDEAFWGGVRHYLERHAHETVHTRHFQRALEEASGRNLDGFFTQWVHSPGHPSIEVRLGKGGRDDADELVTVTVKQTQTAEGVPQVFTFPLRLVLVLEGGAERTVDLEIDERERTWAVPSGGRVATVRVDPGYRLLAEVKLKGPDAWLERLVLDPDPVLALRAARALLADGSRRGLEAVVGALRGHPFHGVRGALADEIGKLGTASARDALVAALASETEPRARRHLASALGAFREAPAADALLRLLDEELPTWQLEGAALVALGQTRDPRARAALEARLGKASWADVVRARALEGLAETEDPAVLDVLVAHTRDVHGDRTRSAAAIALGRLGDAVEDVRRPAMERLVEVLVEPGFRAQLAAISALARLGDPRAEPALARAHRSAPDGRTRRSAYEALARIRRGRTTEQGLAGLRRRLEELSEENAKLRERVDKLER